MEAAPQPSTDATGPAPVPRPSRWWAAGAGLATLTVALGVGQLAAGLHRGWRAPVVSVGDRVIDVTPARFERIAIDVFGTADKPALLTGTVLLLALAAAGAGIVAVRRRPAAGLAVVVALGLVGMLSAAVGRGTSTWGWVPAALSTAAAAVTLSLLVRPASVPPTPASRRQFLAWSGAAVLGAVVAAGVGRVLRSRFATDIERAAVQLRRPARALPAPPADPALQVDGLSPLFVPNRDFYRIDTALIVPSVSTGTWALDIDGMVARPLRLTYDDLWARELVEYDVTLSCVSNEVGGDLVGNARWVGVRLDALLAEVGVDPDADQVLTHSVDGFTAGFPVEAALDGRDAIVALTMNGEVLPAAHGYPARLVVPGLYGYVSATKWLSRIELTRFDRAEGYWIPLGWAAQAPIKTQSRIDTPRAGSTVRAGDTVIAGVAWAPGRGVTGVEVQIDDGPWQPAQLGPSVGDASWRQWWLPWTALPGTATLRCRATDGSGVTQTERITAPAPDGATGWHRVEVDVSR